MDPVSGIIWIGTAVKAAIVPTAAAIAAPSATTATLAITAAKVATAAPAVMAAKTATIAIGGMAAAKVATEIAAAEAAKIAAKELATKVVLAKLELAGKTVASVASVATPVIAHVCNKDAKTQEYELEQKKLDQQSRRTSDAQFIQDLKDSNCGHIGDLRRYDAYCEEVIRRNPAIEFSLGAQIKKCREEARLQQQQALRR